MLPPSCLRSQWTHQGCLWLPAAQINHCVFMISTLESVWLNSMVTQVVIPVVLYVCVYAHTHVHTHLKPEKAIHRMMLSAKRQVVCPRNLEGYRSATSPRSNTVTLVSCNVLRSTKLMVANSTLKKRNSWFSTCYQQL